MATATLTSQLTTVVLDPGAPTGVGTSNAEASETAIHLEGTNCAAMGHSGATGPTSPTAISQFRGGYDTVTGFTRTDMHLHIWVRDLYPIRDVNVGGVSAYIFGGGNEAIYYATGLDKGYGGGWFHYVLNLDAGDRPAASLGTAPGGNITRVGYCGNISATKGEDFLQNAYFDAVRRGTGGQGITLRGGTSGDRLLFSDLAAADTASYGLFRDVGGAFFIEGPITFGVAGQATWLQESLKTINFTNFTVNNGTGGNTVVSAVASDYYRLVLADGTTGVTNVDLTDVTFLGVSRDTPFSLDASALGVGDAYTTTRVTYVFGSTITLGTYCTSVNDTFVECVTVVPSGITLTGPTFNNCDAITLTAPNDELDTASVNTHNTTAGNPFITTDDLAKIVDSTFDNTGGAGHAIEITAIGTYSFVGNTFTGYGANGSSSAAIKNDTGGLVTINVSGGGSSPTVWNGVGATTVVNAAVSVTFSGFAVGTEIRVYRESDGFETAGIETTLAVTWVAGLASGVLYTIVAVFPGYLEIRREKQSFTSDQTFPLNQQIDRNFNDPA